MQDKINLNVRGDVLVKDYQTGEVLLDKKNAVHAKNMAIAIARGLANSDNNQIYKIKLGNQGTFIDTNQQIVFKPANVTADDADLYNATYVEIVDDSDAGISAYPGNSVTFTQVPATTNTRVIVTAVISANEAINRTTDDESGTGVGDGDIGDGLDPEGQFFFDELGLFTKETSGTLLEGPGELLLTHLIFSPIEHTGSRELQIIYSLTISVS